MEIQFKDDLEKKEMRDSIVDCLSSLDHSNPLFTKSRDFLKKMYDSCK